MDNKKEKENTESLDFAKKIADRVNAKKIIIHLGEIENDNCSIKNGIDFVKNNFDDRLHLENTTREFSKFENFKAILEELKINFCFDINHAIINSIKFDREYYPEIKKFIELRPEHYHFCGIKLDTLRDHISLHKSDIDTKKVINILPKDAEITLELTTDKFEVEKDLDMIKDIATIYDSLGRES